MSTHTVLYLAGGLAAWCGTAVVVAMALGAIWRRRPPTSPQEAWARYREAQIAERERARRRRRRKEAR